MEALFASAAILAPLTELRLEDLELALEIALDFCKTLVVAREPTLLIESSGSSFGRSITLDSCLNQLLAPNLNLFLAEDISGPRYF